MLLIGMWTADISNALARSGKLTDFDDVTDHAHDDETDADGLRYFYELSLVGCWR
jgi:hypothetical protein